MVFVRIVLLVLLTSVFLTSVVGQQRDPKTNKPSKSQPVCGGLTELLSKLEFNQAVSLAKTVNNKALSLAAQAAICRMAIESTGEPAKQAGNRSV